MLNAIKIKGAREHNLKNINLSIPRDAITVITGPSGSGKSSLAIDTIYAEGQRRYVESLSAYARQFLARLPKPDVDSIDGLSPAIAIDQQRAAGGASPARDLERLRRDAYVRVDVDGVTRDLEEPIEVDRVRPHTLHVYV